MEFGDIDQRVLSEIDKMFPGLDRRYISWRQLKTLKHHLLVAVSRHLGDSIPNNLRFLALHTSGRSLDLGSTLWQTSTGGLLVLLREEGLRVESQNCADIIELFGLMHHQKKILESANDLEQMVRKGKDRIQAHIDIIRPPSFTVKDKVRTITFWVVDFWTGDLEQWEILEDSQGEIRIENKVLEASLIYVLR